MTQPTDDRQHILPLSRRYLQDCGHTEELEWVEPTYKTMERKGFFDRGTVDLSEGRRPTEDSIIGDPGLHLPTLAITIIGGLIVKHGVSGLQSIVRGLRDREHRDEHTRQLGLRRKEALDEANKIYTWILKIEMELVLCDLAEPKEPKKQ